MILLSRPPVESRRANDLVSSKYRRSARLRVTSAFLPLIFAVALLASPGSVSSAGATSSAQGYLLVGSDGGAFNYGNVGFYGSEAGQVLNKPIVAAAVTNNGGGYIEIGGDGGVFSFGNALNDGSIYTFGHGSSQSWFNGNIVGGALSSDNGGYWLVSNNGWVCGFGDATVYSATNRLLGTNNCWSVGSNATIVGLAPDTANSGYWFVTNVGSVYAFNGAPYYGGSPGITNAVGIVASAGGVGYRIAGSDGGVFNYNAAFYGSVGGGAVTNVTGIFTTAAYGGSSTSGYILVRSNGAAFFFGDAAFLGSMEGQTLVGPIVGIS